MVITGNTQIIAHIGYPTHTFKSPMIYNPYIEHAGIPALVVPMGSKADDYPALLKALFTLTNIAGALITMPHKVTTTGLVERVSPTAQIAGACNAVRLGADGKLEGDMFDGEGFVRGITLRGFNPQGKTALVVGSGGVGSAIAASLAAAGAVAGVVARSRGPPARTRLGTLHGRLAPSLRRGERAPRARTPRRRHDRGSHGGRHQAGQGPQGPRAGAGARAGRRQRGATRPHQSRAWAAASRGRAR